MSSAAQQNMSQQETETKVQAMQERDQLTDKALSQHCQKSAHEAVEQAQASSEGTTEAAKNATGTNK